MANLKDIASRHNINLNLTDKAKTPPSQITIVNTEKKEGRLRRVWLEEELETASNKTESKQDLNHVKTKEEQGLNGVQTGAITPLQTTSEHPSNMVQTGFKRVSNGVLKLQGNPCKVMIFLIQNRSIDEPYFTEKFSISDIAKNTELSKESVKTAIKFLKKNNLIFLSSSYTGIYGWSSYILDKSFTDKLIKQGLNRVQTGDINSSSNKILNTTTNELPREWKELDISGLQRIGFYQSKLEELYKNGCSLEIVRRSINAASNDLKKGIKIYINKFMGALNKGREWSSLDSEYEDEELKQERLQAEARTKKLAEIEILRKKALEDEVAIWAHENEDLVKKALNNLSLLNVYKAIGLKDKEVKEILTDYYVNNLKK